MTFWIEINQRVRSGVTCENNDCAVKNQTQASSTESIEETIAHLVELHCRRASTFPVIQNWFGRGISS
jgi:aspartate carbamoyltransferase regulatory subunit